MAAVDVRRKLSRKRKSASSLHISAEGTGTKITPVAPLSNTSQSDVVLDDWEMLDDSLLVKGTALASEYTLRQLWDTPEEDEAWRDL